MDLLTFPTTANSLDILSIGGSIVAQKGSSGGAVVSQNDGTLIGIIVTTSIEDTTGERDLGALTLTHINNSLVRDIGVGLASLLADAPAIQVQQFSGLTAPALTKALEDVLDTQR
jgi:hypothetical protein